MEFTLSLALIAALVLIWTQCTQIDDMEKDRAQDADIIDDLQKRLRDHGVDASLKGGGQ